METGPQNDQAMIRSLQFSAHPTPSSRGGEGLETQLTICHAYVRRPPESPVVVSQESFHTGKHLHQEGVHPKSIEAKLLQLAPSQTLLCTCLYLATHPYLLSFPLINKCFQGHESLWQSN